MDLKPQKHVQGARRLLKCFICHLYHKRQIADPRAGGSVSDKHVIDPLEGCR
jgi:hypothetical protein